MIHRKSFKRAVVCATIASSFAIATAAKAELAHADLLAGQDLVVGDVWVEENLSGEIEVTYTITDPDWCLQEVHTDIGTNESDIPQTRSGNPKVGKFEVNLTLDCETDITVNLGPTPMEDFVVAAHAVVDTQPVCDGEGILFGTERDIDAQPGDRLYEIDIVGSSEAPLATVPDDAPNNVNSPNGLAYDPANNDLYFSVTENTGDDTESELWQYDIDTDTFSGPLQITENAITDNLLAAVSAGATFFMGNYLYFENRSENLKEVDVGNTPADETLLDDDVDGSSVVDDAQFRFGDAVVIPGTTILLGSSNQRSNADGTDIFFSYDLSDGTYTELCDIVSDSDCATPLQMSFGSNGILYAHSAGTGDWWEVDPTTGLRTTVAPIFSGVLYTDLASGPQCVPDEETAWGDGTRFVEPGNWATFIEVSLPE